MIFEQIAVGGDRNFAYLIGDKTTGKAAVVDPSYSPELVAKHAAEHDLTIEYLFNTHGHFDHANGNDYFTGRHEMKFISGGAGGVPDGHTVSLGAVTLTVLFTPGHTTDSICIHVREEGDPGKLCTGDTLFVGKVGGTDLSEGARTEYESLHKLLSIVPDETEVWPGHDYGVSPQSTILHEKQTNPFLLRESFESFVDLKKNWLEYKREHGIA